MNFDTQSFMRVRGVTLVELMIAMVISLIVMIGVATVYATSKRAYKVQEEMSRLQENARFAFEDLTRNLRQAGYYGSTPTVKSFLQNSTSESFNLNAGVSGFEFRGTAPGASYTITSLSNTGAAGDWTAVDGDDSDSSPDNLPGWLSGKVLSGNDVIRVVYATSTGGACQINGAAFNGTAAALPLNGSCNISKGSLVFVSDGLNTNLFQNVANNNASTLSRGVATGTLAPGNISPSSDSWSVKCETNGCTALEAAQYAYYIGRGASGEPALFRADLSQGTGTNEIRYQELVEGVENMQILYGIDTNPTDDNFQPNRYVTADNPVLQFDNVVAVRISLLLRTPQELNRNPAAGTFRLLGVENSTGVDITTLADRRIHKIFTTTIHLRNKALYRRDFKAEL